MGSRLYSDCSHFGNTMAPTSKDPDTSATESEEYSESESDDYLSGLNEEQKVSGEMILHSLNLSLV